MSKSIKLNKPSKWACSSYNSLLNFNRIHQQVSRYDTKINKYVATANDDAAENWLIQHKGEEQVHSYI